jgi:hypothetical protein
MPPPSVWQLLYVLLVLAVVIGIPIGLAIWAIIEIVEVLR